MTSPNNHKPSPAHRVTGAIITFALLIPLTVIIFAAGRFRNPRNYTPPEIAQILDRRVLMAHSIVVCTFALAWCLVSILTLINKPNAHWPDRALVYGLDLFVLGFALFILMVALLGIFPEPKR